MTRTNRPEGRPAARAGSTPLQTRAFVFADRAAALELTGHGIAATTLRDILTTGDIGVRGYFTDGTAVIVPSADPDEPAAVERLKRLGIPVRVVRP